MVGALVDRGANVVAEDKDGKTTFHVFIKSWWMCLLSLDGWGKPVLYEFSETRYHSDVIYTTYEIKVWFSSYFCFCPYFPAAV